MTEKINYSVIQKDHVFELRQYPAYIKAEVELADTTYRKAIFDGFSLLAGFIFGENVGAENIAMTSPVQVSSVQKIAMTKPVIIAGNEAQKVAFIMPSEWTMETLPQPKNPALCIREIQAQRMAAAHFSDHFREARVNKAKQRLKAWLENES